MDLLHKNWQYGTVLKSLTAPWCSFFQTLSSEVYFMNKGHTKIASPAKKTWKISLVISTLRVLSTFNVLMWTADTEGSGSELYLIRSFSALLTFSLCGHARESSYTEKQQFPKLRRAHGTALEGGIGTSVSPAITGRRDLGSGEIAENTCFCLHW